MNDKQKQHKKLFSAPSKKINNVQENQDVLKEKLKKPVSQCNKNKKDSDEHTPRDPKTDGKNKQKQKAKRVPKSLTDEEYADIFQSVLDKALNDDPVLAKDLQNVQQLSHNTLCPDVKKCEDEVDVITSYEQVDQWNERSEDEDKKIVSMEKKKKKEKIQDSPDSLKTTKKSKKKCLSKTNTSAAKEFDLDISVEKDICVDSDENNDSEEESGTWIQCSISDCGKWRYVADIPDPIQVPDLWDCSMNSDKDHNSCDAQEEEYDESDHILTKFTLGSVVWAKMDGFPWWPAMVDTDPDYDTYFELPTMTSMIPTIYHITFFDEHVSRAWIRSHLIAPYDHKSIPKNKFSFKSQSHKKELKAAITNAETALNLNLKERLNQYSFVRRYPATKTLKGKNSRRRRKIGNTQADGLAGKKENTAEEILSASSTMLKELDMAITTCNNSGDEDCSDDVSGEEIEEASTESHQNLIEAKNCTTSSHNGEFTKVSSDSAEAAVDTDTQDMTKFEKGQLVKSSKEDTVESGPASLNIESNSQVDNLQGCENSIHEHDKPSLSSGVTNSDDELIKATAISKGSTSKSLFNLGGVKNKMKSAKERKIKGKSKAKDTSSTKSNKRKSDEDNEEKNNHKVPQTNTRDMEQFVTEFDSEKENKDPKHSEPKETNLLSRKRKIEKHSDENSDKYQEKMFTVESECKTKCSASETKKKKRSKKEGNLQTASLVKQKNLNKDHILSSEGKKIKKSNNENQIMDNIVYNKTKKVKNNIRERIHGQNLRKNGEIRQTDEEAGKDSTKTKNLQKLTDTTDTEKSFDVDSEMKSLADSMKKDSSRKESSKSKGFINPLKCDDTIKSTVRNVPCILKEEIDQSKSKVHNDQLVPNLVADLIKDDEELSCIETERQDKVENDKISREENCVEELNISIDSLEGDSQDGDCGIITDLKMMNDNVNTSTPIDKNEYGSFGGHCINHESDSDPFELIEE